MAKVEKSGSGNFAKGGSGKMFGKQHASPMPAGQTGRPDGGSDGKFAKGGTTKMFGKQSANTMTPGQTGK